MLPGLVSTVLSTGVALVLGVAAARLTLPLWRGRAHVGAAYGVGGIGLVSMAVFVGYWMHPALGAVVAIALMATAIAIIIATRAWRLVAAGWPVLALTVAVLLCYLGLLYFWGSDAESYGSVYWHFGDLGLPPDNTLPFLFSDTIAAGTPTHHFFEDWNGSDRPPLQAGFLLLIRSLTSFTGGVSTFSFGASVVCQLLWVPVLFAALRSVGTARRAAFIAVVFAAATGTVLFNTLYTWPKLLSAAFVISACVVLIDAIRRPRAFRAAFPAAVVLFVLGMLSHGAAAFSLPLVIWLGVLSYRRQPPRRVLASSAVALGAGLLVYLPWLAFQRFADPPGDRLLKWHLLGITRPDGRSFGAALVDQFSALTPGEWIAARLQNLDTVFEPNPFSGVSCLCEESVLGRRSTEFFTTTTALGIALPLIVAILLLLLVRRARGVALSSADGGFVAAVAASVACVLFWCLLMYGGGTTVVHQGSHVWILLLLAAPIAWLARRRRTRWIAWAAVAVHGAVAVLVYLPQPTGSTGAQPGAAIMAAIGVALAALAWRGLSPAPLFRRPVVRRTPTSR